MIHFDYNESLPSIDFFAGENTLLSSTIVNGNIINNDRNEEEFTKIIPSMYSKLLLPYQKGPGEIVYSSYNSTKNNSINHSMINNIDPI